jgi:hypothetical protein
MKAANRPHPSKKENSKRFDAERSKGLNRADRKMPRRAEAA